LVSDRVLIVGPGGGKELGGDAATLGQWVKKGGHVLALGLDGTEAEAFLSSKIGMKKGEYIRHFSITGDRNWGCASVK
jgi:hypothetical protein